MKTGKLHHSLLSLSLALAAASCTLAQTPPAPPGMLCMPPSFPMALNGKFAELELSNQVAQNCSYVYTMNQDVISFSFLPSGLDNGTSTVSIYTNSSGTIPDLILSNDALVMLNASAFPDGLFFTVQGDGSSAESGVPLELLITTAATCLPPLEPLGLINIADADLLSNAALDLPLTYCVDPPSVVEVMPNDLLYSTVFNLTLLPKIYAQGFATVFQPNISAVLPGACFEAALETSDNTTADSYLLLLNNSTDIDSEIIGGVSSSTTDGNNTNATLCLPASASEQGISLVATVDPSNATSPLVTVTLYLTEGNFTNSSFPPTPPLPPSILEGDGPPNGASMAEPWRHSAMMCAALAALVLAQLLLV